MSTSCTSLGIAQAQVFNRFRNGKNNYFGIWTFAEYRREPMQEHL
jgi:hypothetical protein